MGNCLGAFGLHLGSRFDAAHRAWLALLGRTGAASSPPPAPIAAGCEWIGDTRINELPDFPDFPAEFDAFQVCACRLTPTAISTRARLMSPCLVECKL